MHAASTQSSDPSPEIQGIQRQLDKLESRLDASATTKDWWDKFDLIGKFIAGVLLVTIGGVFTFIYNSAQKEKEHNLTVERQQTYKIETVSRFIPYFAHEKDSVRRSAILVIQGLVDTETATQLALLNVGPETPGTLTELRVRAEGVGAATADKALQRVVSTGPFSVLKTYFVTTRAPLDPEGTTFGSERAQPSFGVASVSIPRQHVSGALEGPSVWSLELDENKESHLTITNQNTIPADAFFQALQTELQEKDKNDFLLYVHGFNVTFAHAAKRVAQITYDIAYEGIPILYSWPSAASVYGYLQDQNNVEWGASSFESLLKGLLEKFPNSTVRVIGHSLGARLPLKALVEVGDNLDRGPIIDDIVLIAPDIDAQVFRLEYAEKIRKYARRVTLYSYPDDHSLKAARLVHGHPRAGGDPVIVVPGVDTVVVTKGDFTELFIDPTDSGGLLNDLHTLLVKGLPPEQRPTLTRVSRGTGNYWQLN